MKRVWDERKGKINKQLRTNSNTILVADYKAGAETFMVPFINRQCPGNVQT